LVWLFGTISNVTDTLLFFLPRRWTHEANGAGQVHWYWSFVALLFAVFLISLVGRFARHYFGKKIIKWIDRTLLHVPLLNKIYGTVKQVNEAFSSNKSSFKQVVLVKFPHTECQSIGFVTGEQKSFSGKNGKKMFSVFVPTTPNPTSGFLLFVAEDQITKVNMSVPDGIKLIISAGSISPDQAAPGSTEELAAAAAKNL
jgi:uncharacterized membrane protein